MNIHIAYGGEEAQTLEQLLKTQDTGNILTFVANQDVADLIVVENSKALSQMYTPQKQFVIFSDEDPGPLENNVRYVIRGAVLTFLAHVASLSESSSAAS